MIEIYKNIESITDRYMVIIDNPDRELEDHKPYYDISIDINGNISHGSEWSQREVDQLHERARKDYSTIGASYAYKRIRSTELSTPVKNAILMELESQ
jgi:hypothetical protein